MATSMKASIQVLGGNGYIWDADVAHWLRLECGLVGAMVGGVAAFKQQNAVHGLPLELSPEEVSLALERGWGELQAPLHTGRLAAALAAADSGSKQRGREAAANPYQYYEDDQDQKEAENGDYDVQDATGEPSEQAAAPAPAEPTWRAALTDGSAFNIPATLAEAAAANGAVEAAGSHEAATEAAQGAAGEEAAARAEGAAAAAAEWDFPCTREERHRFWVFRDLHAKGFRLTGGSKFGADYLVYPGDPTLYHAQFCVRLMPYDQPMLPAMLASATRGSHQARKHLLIASVVEGEEERERGEEPAAAAPPPQGQEAAAAAGEATGAAGSGPQQAGEGWQLGANSRGMGSKGEWFRISYMTIGPVEGFG